jgi:hypothetical protein
MSRNIIIALMYHRHKLLGLIYINRKFNIPVTLIMNIILKYNAV